MSIAASAGAALRVTTDADRDVVVRLEVPPGTCHVDDSDGPGEPWPTHS
jgi:hypothetical protein